MVEENTLGILLAGGYGAIRPGISKLLESVSLDCEKPMICCVHDVFKTLHIPTVVVVNNVYQDQVRKVLYCCDHFVIQKERVGHGGAVHMCVPFISLLEKHYAKSILAVVILYGDMPLWRHDTIHELIESHKKAKAAVSMFSIEVDERCPDVVRRYGRILKNREGKIIRGA